MKEPELDLAPETGQELFLFRKCLPYHLRLQESLRFLEGGTEGRVCLDVGAGNAVVSYHLRKLGGEWHTVPGPDQSKAAVKTVVGKNVKEAAGGALPFGDKTFDVVVVFDALQRVASPEEFIAECHRVMKPDGRLIIHSEHAKAWSLVRPIRSLLRVTYERRGLSRSGYTESDLFALLKHGFDVHQVRSYSRFWVEVVDAASQAMLARRDPTSPEYADSVRGVYSIVGPLYRLAYQLDLLLFFTRGHSLVAIAKRRAWRPRNAPVLVDGRSISEVVLSRAPH
jgi:SAM-dependent methyltransferase